MATATSIPPSTQPTKSASIAGPKLSGAATRGYNVASAWDHTATLTDSQLSAIDAVGQACSHRPFPSHVVEDQRGPVAGPEHGESTGNGVQDAYVGTLETAVLHNVNQFHKWHSELEAACASEMEEKYKRYADLLNSHLSACEAILAKADSTLDLFDTLLVQHRDVSARSKALHSSCEALVREKDQLLEFADAIRTKLRFFDEFETVYAQFQKVQLSLDNEQFLSLLRKLDDCMAYVAANPQYADAGAYSSKFRQLQARALSAVRSKVQQVFKHAVQQVQAAIQEATPKAGAAGQANGAAGKPHAAGSQQVPVLAEGMEVSLLYVRFRAAAEPSLKGLLKEIESREGRPEYLRLMEECQSLYAQARQQLLAPFVSQRLSAEQGSQSLPALTRAGCEHLLRVCQLEAQLFEQFFPKARSAAEHLAALTDPLCTLLYDVLRPAIIGLHDVDELCELVDVLKHEVLGDQLGRRGAGGEALRPTLTRTLADVQGRLIFRCQAFIKEEVAAYTPTPADFDYPAKLIAAAQASQQHQQQQQQEGEAGQQGQGEDGAGQQGPDPYASLYPPLRATLVVLSKLYRAVDTHIFSGLAQEAVAAVTLSVQQASRAIARKSTTLDAQLFMVKHLLFLREQIAPFDVDFAVTDVDLDFTHTRDHMRRLMTGDMSLLTLGSSAGVVKLLGAAGPRVLTYQVDSKKDLEKQLKGVCEAFIMAVTKVAVEPMLSFITKVTAVKVATSANPAAAKPLREQAFASPEKVAEMVARVNEALAGPLAAAVSKMRLYLPSPSTHAILFKPVKSNIAEAHGQVAMLLSQEYTPEEAAAIPLKQPDELAAVLDGLC